MKNIILFSLSTLLFACGSKLQEQVAMVDSLQTNVITLTSLQYKSSNITLGELERIPVAQRITVNGKLDVPPQNLVIISAPLGGFVKSTKLLPGMKVKKGVVLAVLENQEYIQLQQDYLDNCTKLEYVEADYIRQQELARENVNALKSLQLAKSQYESLRAMVSGLEAKLAMINLSPSSVKKGKIKSTINLHAPITGFITMVNVNIGQFVNATDVLFKIVNLEQMHAELQVYERDINKIAVGQRVTFRLANDSSSYQATVYLVGKEISPERTVQVHCHLNTKDRSLLPGMFVTAVIETASKETDVVPTTAISSFEGKDYVFVSSGDNQFKAIRVATGNSIDNFTEVQLQEKMVSGTTIVTTGAFELMGLLKNKQE
jgi:membrane fusion protein, heavy metal efflux system